MSQKHRISSPLLSAMATIAFAFSSLVLAGTATLESRTGGSVDLEYGDSKLRVSMPGTGGGYMLVRDNTMYIVSTQGGQTMVMDASAMMIGMAPAAGQMAPTPFNSEFVSLKDTGRDETVADMAGDVYEFTYKDENGTEKTEEVVLSDDKRATELLDAIYSLSSIAGDMAGENAMEKGRELKERMDAMGVGVVRYGNEMRLTSVTTDAVPDARFELPAAPMDFSKILQGMQKQ